MATQNAINTGFPLEITSGGTGLATITDHSIIVGSGTGAVTPLSVGTDGQVLVGSTGADPVFTNISSTDSSITITEGAGTLALTGTQSTTTQLGSVELATDAEAVDGTDSDRPIVPTSLAAKLGTQTDHGLLVGSGTDAAITALSVGATGEMLIGSTGADPSWSATGALTTLNATTVNATTFDTNIAAAGVTLSGTSFVADGTDANIDINITAKGSGQVVIDDLELTTDLAVTEGGTGASTFTDGGLLVGAGASTIEALAVGGTGTILTGVAGANPTWTTATYPATAAVGTILIASGANTITTLAPDTAGYVLTDGGAGVAPSWGAVGGGTVTSVSGGTNISASGTAGDPVMDLDAAITGMTSITMADTGSIQSTTTNTDTMLIQGYDVDGTAYVPFITITNANDPTCDLNTGVTLGTKYIYRADGTDVPVADGGTGASTLTDHGVLVGSGTSAVTPLTVGTNGQVLVGSTGADPVFVTIASADSSIEITGGAGTLDLSASGIISINAETGTTYEFVLSDVGKLVTCTNASAITVTVPVNSDVAIPIGSQILVTQLGAGVVTLAPESGVTLNSRGSLLDTNGQYATVACIKRDTDVWLISGDLA